MHKSAKKFGALAWFALVPLAVGLYLLVNCILAREFSSNLVVNFGLVFGSLWDLGSLRRAVKDDSIVGLARRALMVSGVTLLVMVLCYVPWMIHPPKDINWGMTAAFCLLASLVLGPYMTLAFSHKGFWNGWGRKVVEK